MVEPTAPRVPLRSLRGGALRFSALLALVAALPGCPREREGAAAADASRPQDGAPSVGLRVPLPRGWTARAEAGDVLAIGPAGRDVMRLRRADKNKLPSLEKLKKEFSSSLKGLRVATLAEREEGDLVLWRVRLTSEAPPSTSWPAAIGARKVQDTIYLCATEPGATDGEVKEAAEACAGLGR